MNNTLVKGLLLLEQLAHSDRPLGITELAASLELNKSNVHRMLQSLVALNYVQQDASAAYHTTIRLWELGAAVLAHFDVRGAAAPFMERLLTHTRETIHLSILEGAEVVYLHKLDSPEPVRAYTQVGARAPAHCVATGKALLAEESPARIAALSQKLVRYTKNTIVDVELFQDELRRIRQNGYAVNRGEWRESVHGIAAPIRGANGQTVAAIGISGPAERIRPSQFKALAAKVVEAAVDITKALASVREANTTQTMLAGMRRAASGAPR